MNVTISKTTDAYDPSIYERPWIAVVTLDPLDRYDGPNSDRCGCFHGKEGEPGELILEAKPGSGVAFGQAAKVKGRRDFVGYAVV